ncbi:MAG: aminopeptidase N, partial [Robiginitomaculum sp.]
MRTDSAPTPTLLSAYKAPEFQIDTVYLDVALNPAKTRVRSTMHVRRTGSKSARLTLNGEDIALTSVAIDGVDLPRSAYGLSQTHLTLKNLPEKFTLEINSTCAPKDNSQLMGLYVSGGRFCTQCEAEGFRRFTFFLDRPDVLSVYTVRIEADKDSYPTLLANGNMIDSGDLPGRHHYAVWEDPFPKPCYLFALVAGQFDKIDDSFTTMSGRDIPLEIYVDPGDSSRAHYAMDALKRSMKWDEEAFGREYDLDRFMIVAVRDFNFGAMENKGLNIFNSALLLADAQSATDMNFQRIESVVAHEYFHNWTGNRITCRDWFQLCLKEGFTVFRDQEFSAHERGAPLQRIKDVKALRARQFPEDAGPLAHAVRPESYQKIDNFYTATIYEKGAEIIRMLKTLLGEKAFRAGSDLYFEALDGTAATIEEFITCFETSTGKDLSQFMLWYSQAGTPELTVKTAYDAGAKTFTVSLSQKTMPTPGQPRKQPLLMPISLGLIDDTGRNFGAQTFALKSETATLKVEDLPSKPTLSILKGFSAPVRLNYARDTGDTLIQMAHDADMFNRWEAGQSLARDLLVSLTSAI